MTQPQPQAAKGTPTHATVRFGRPGPPGTDSAEGGKQEQDLRQGTEKRGSRRPQRHSSEGWKDTLQDHTLPTEVKGESGLRGMLRKAGGGGYLAAGPVQLLRFPGQ